MNRTRLVVLAALAGWLLLPAQADANLLLNPGAELHPPNVFPEWGPGVIPSPISSGASPNALVKSVASHVLPDTSVVTPHSGNRFFSVAEANSAVSGGAGFGDRVFLRQRGDIAPGTEALKLTGWFQTGNVDTAGVIVSIINATQTMTYMDMSLFNLGSSVGGWTQFSTVVDLTHLSFVPAIFRVELRGTYRGDTNTTDLRTDVFFDDVALVAVPEPTTIVVWTLLCCCVGLIGLRRWKLHAPQAA